MKDRKNEVFAQVSESRVGRVLRTEDYLLGVVAAGLYGGKYKNSELYTVDYFYDLKKDPDQLSDRKTDTSYKSTIRSLCDELEYVIKKEEKIESRISF